MNEATAGASGDSDIREDDHHHQEDGQDDSDGAGALMAGNSYLPASFLPSSLAVLLQLWGNDIP